MTALQWQKFGPSDTQWRLNLEDGSWLEIYAKGSAWYWRHCLPSGQEKASGFSDNEGAVQLEAAQSAGLSAHMIGEAKLPRS